MSQLSARTSGCALGGLHPGTNELIGEDCNAIIRLAPVQCNGIDGNVAVMGISLYRLDDIVVLLCQCSVACDCACELVVVSAL